MRHVPPATDARYVETLVALIEQEKIDYAIPMSEVELGALLPLIEAERHVRWITAGPTALAVGIDKLETMRALQALGVPVPWTVEAAGNEPPALPCILKSRRGSGSRSVFRVEDTEEARYLARRHPGSVFQELLPDADREVTCAVYRTRDGRVATLQMRRRLTGGFTGWAVVIDDPRISALCETVAAGLELTGAMNVQLRITDQGPRIFEINPRYSSTVLMRHEIGFTDVAWAFDELDGKPVTFPRIPAGSTIVRVQGAAVVPQGPHSHTG